MAERFAFGENWRRFLSSITGERIAEAERSLEAMLGAGALRGHSFLDIGCGSGLFSLAALRRGASRAHAFDFDPQSVACTRELKRLHLPGDDRWTIETGDVLDRNYVERLGRWDIVYAWGVLHHTGDLWTAMDRAASAVAEGGRFFVAVYNDQGLRSRIWRRIKRLYNRMPRPVQGAMAAAGFVVFGGGLIAKALVTARNPFARFSGRGRRGMSVYRNVVDWLGGYPFEVARPDTVLGFGRDRGLKLLEMKTCGGSLGCNEFVFVKPQGPSGDGARA